MNDVAGDRVTASDVRWGPTTPATQRKVQWARLAAVAASLAPPSRPDRLCRRGYGAAELLAVDAGDGVEDEIGFALAVQPEVGVEDALRLVPGHFDDLHSYYPFLHPRCP